MAAASSPRAGAARAAAAGAPGAAPRRVLLTNDDGPASPFFEPLVRVLAGRMGWSCTSAARPESAGGIARVCVRLGRGRRRRRD